MSDTQSDPTPTEGPWVIREDSALTRVGPRGERWDIAELHLPDEHMSTPIMEVPVEAYNKEKANARLIAAAGTAAHELPSEYDPVAAVRTLPELLHLAEEFEKVFRVLEKNYPGKFDTELRSVDKLLATLDAARGDD